MKTYKLIFKNISTTSKLPDAQTIFGSICSIIKFTQSEKKLDEYLQSLNNKPLFVHSSMFLNGLLPMPKIGLISIEEKNYMINNMDRKDRLEYLSYLKKFKKVHSITEDVYQDYLTKDLFNNLKDDLFNNELKLEEGIISKNKYNYNTASQLVVHNNHSTKLDDRKLYYDNTVYYGKNTEFVIYIKTDYIDEVRSIFKYSQYFGFGNRVSVGKNCFKLIDIEEIAINSNSKKCLLLSKCISNEFDLNNSSYIIDSKVFKGSNYYSSNVIGRINKFVEGSYMIPLEHKEYYGKIIKLNNGKDIYHYGIGFVL